MRRTLGAVWQRWRVIAERIGHVQAQLIFGLLYFLIVTPFALGVKVFADPLGLKSEARNSSWRPLSRQTLDLEDARRQF